MTNKEANQRVRKAFSSAVPDTFEQILEKCNNTQGEEKIIKMPRRKSTVLRQMVSVAAMVALVLTSGLAGYGIGKIRTVDSVISFDVNPSIEIQLSKDEKIVKAFARNEDGEKILGNMDLTGSDLTVAVNAIIGSMLRSGYLDEISNSILVSVDCSDEKKGEALEKRIFEEISMLLSGEAFDAAVISQTISHAKEIEKLAAEYGITKGKAQLIQQIIKANPDKYTFKDLASLTINELNLIASGEKVNITSNGTASEKRYIGKSRAKKIALKDDGVDKNDISGYKCKLKYKGGRMVYEISFETAKAKYEYIVNALSGKIIKSEIERKPQDDNLEPATPEMVDETAAKATALSLAGVTEEQVVNFACTLVDTAETPYYIISFFVGETEYSYNINAFTGELMTISTENTGEVPEDETSSEQISSDAASSQVSGTSGGTGSTASTVQ